VRKEKEVKGWGESKKRETYELEGGDPRLFKGNLPSFHMMFPISTGKSYFQTKA
jgi:hypothetical protein